MTFRGWKMGKFFAPLSSFIVEWSVLSSQGLSRESAIRSQRTRPHDGLSSPSADLLNVEKELHAILMDKIWCCTPRAAGRACPHHR